MAGAGAGHALQLALARELLAHAVLLLLDLGAAPGARPHGMLVLSPQPQPPPPPPPPLPRGTASSGACVPTAICIAHVLGTRVHARPLQLGYLGVTAPQLAPQRCRRGLHLRQLPHVPYRRAPKAGVRGL